MLAYFPTLFEDELLYSGIARYQQNSGNRTQKETIEDLFGNRLVCASADLPSHIQFLSDQLSGVYTAEQVIRNHTLFPYYSYFQTGDRQKEGINLMKNGAHWGEVHSLLGLLACNVKMPSKLKFCLECFTHDNTKYGNPYWHRVHQIPGVYMCPMHGIPLCLTDIDYGTRDHKFSFITLSSINEKNYKEVTLKSEWINHLEYVSVQSLYLLNSYEYFQSKVPHYSFDLYKKGFITANKRVRFNSFIDKLVNYYGDDLLDFMSCQIDRSITETWLHKLVRGNRAVYHPLRHILLIKFLDASFDAIFQHRNIEPFGKGPWPCLNKAADHYKLEVITKVQITNCYTTKRPVGTFSCGCGFSYSRRGPDSTGKDRLKIGRIKSFGDVWKDKLRQLNLKDISLRKKAAILGVDPGTVKNQTKLLEKVKTDGQTYAKVTSIAENLPSKQLNAAIRTKNKKKQTTRIDWQKRDSDLNEEIEVAVYRILSYAKPTRITLAAISRASKLRIPPVKFWNKLPKTKMKIKSHLETTIEFQIRRLNWAVEVIRTKEMKIKGWRLLKLAGLDKPLHKEVEKHYLSLISDEDKS